jgi:hypothetical protein
MKRYETLQILHHRIKCCGDLIVLKTNIVTAQVTIRPKMCILTELERGKVGPVTLHRKIRTTTVLFIVQIDILLIQAIIQAKLQMHLLILQMTGLSTLALLGKNTTTVVVFHSGKNQEWLEREQRQKEANKMAVNSFPKDRDYRREVMQATATSGFASGSKY